MYNFSPHGMLFVNVNKYSSMHYKLYLSFITPELAASYKDINTHREENEPKNKTVLLYLFLYIYK